MVINSVSTYYGAHESKMNWRGCYEPSDRSAIVRDTSAGAGIVAERSHASWRWRCHFPSDRITVSTSPLGRVMHFSTSRPASLRSGVPDGRNNISATKAKCGNSQGKSICLRTVLYPANAVAAKAEASQTDLSMSLLLHCRGILPL